MKIIKEYLSMMRKYHISAYASSIAFFTYLSLVPIMLTFFSVLPYTPLTEAKLMEILVNLLPEHLVPMAISMVNNMYDSSTAVLSVSIFVLIWSGAKGMLALLRGLNVIHHVEQKGNYVFLRFRASLYTVLLLGMILILLILVVFGEWLVEILNNLFPGIHYLFDFLFQIRSLFLTIVLTLFFGAAYTWLPDGENNRFRFELPGAFLASVFWYAASLGFSVYVNHFFSYNVYGSLATVTIIMLWLYLCFYIVLAGALLNRFLMPAFEYAEECIRFKRKR